MKEEIRQSLKATPNFVQDSIYEDYTTDAISEIREKYLENDKERVESLKNITGLAILKDIKLEEIKDRIQNDLVLDDQSSKEISLIILTKIFYPIKDFFPGIEDEILKLGGEIPKEAPKKSSEQLLKREEEMGEMSEAEKREEAEKMKDTIIKMSIKDLIKNYPIVESQQIGSQESIVVQGMDVPMKPVIKFWIRDYLEKMGYNRHYNLDRVSYIYHDKNTRNMNEEERRQLGLVLKSLDEEISLPFSTKKQKIDFSKVVEE